MNDPMSASVSIDPDHHRGVVGRWLFGSFVEHMGRGVYTGIFEPDHPGADEHGFRSDVAELVSELGVTLVRYPGGNFVSGYRWEDGIGPRDRRPRRLDLAWRSIEPNTVGTDEFLGWAARQRLEPMMAVNLGTRGIQAAADLVEYCNIDQGTIWSDLRRANGAQQPYGVRLWCLGNEMDGPWQLGHKNADAYGALAAEAGKAMKFVDPSIQLVVCGSSGRTMPTFGHWESTVLEHTYDIAEYISLHAYYEELDGDRSSFLGSGAAMDTHIRDVIAIADGVGARRGSRKRIGLSFDEWNVWYMRRFTEAGTPEIAEAAPRIEDIYSGVDAVVVGDLLVTLINHADRVAVGCLAQLVNVIAPIMTEPGGPAWRQTTFHPIAETIRAARGHSLVTAVNTPTLSTARHGDVPAISAAATHDPETGTVSVFLVNRSAESARVTLRHRGFERLRATAVRTVVAGEDPDPADSAMTAADLAARGANAAPTPMPVPPADAGTTTVDLAPRSWTVLTLDTPA